MTTTIRPSREQAEQAITEFLQAKLGDVPCFGMVEDGEECWAFWVYPEELPPGADDTTSYVHADLSIEWYGTSWVPGQEALAA
jgi:hypothetical protein